MGQKDLEKLAMLDAIQTTACHSIDPKALKTLAMATFPGISGTPAPAVLGTRSGTLTGEI